MKKPKVGKKNKVKTKTSVGPQKMGPLGGGKKVKY